MPNKLDDQIKKFGEYKQKFFEDLSTGLVANLFGSDSTKIDSRSQIDEPTQEMEYIQPQKILTIASDDEGSDIDDIPEDNFVEPIDNLDRQQDEQQICAIDSDVQKKEALLSEIKKVQAELQENLLGEMKQKYD